jgi:xylulose-5-phosphate/fructose-6-phosphate phosphoketolase
MQFGMLMLNDMDRFHLVADVIDRLRALGARVAQLRRDTVDERLLDYAREAGDDLADVRDWALPAG